MKKPLLLLLSLIALSQTNKAQTLTAQNTNPQIGEVYNVAKGPYFNPGNAGTGQVWNFASQIPAPAVSHTFLTPAQSNVSNSFTNCNMGMPNIEIPHRINMLDVSSSGIEHTGNKGSIYFLTASAPEFIYSNTKKELIYPMSAGVTFTDNWSGMFQNGTLIYNTLGSQTVTADGTGTLTTFLNTYTNVLRIHSVSTNTNIEFFVANGGTNTITTVESFETYSWYSPGIHTPVLVVKKNTIVGVPSVSLSIFYNLPANPVGIEEKSETLESQISVNNPVNAELKITSDVINFEHTSIQVYDGSGRLVLDAIPEQESKCSIDVSFLEGGLYYLNMLKDDQLLLRKKVVIQH